MLQGNTQVNVDVASENANETDQKQKSQDLHGEEVDTRLMPRDKVVLLSISAPDRLEQLLACLFDDCLEVEIVFLGLLGHIYLK